MTPALPPPGLVADLTAIVGAAHLLTEPDVTAGYRRDWTGRFATSRPVPVVRPGSTAEVAAVVAACRAHGAGVVPQGGNTGLVGGGVPLEAAVVLSLRRLAPAVVVDPVAGTAVAGAGTTIGELGDAAALHGLRYGVDLASRDSATVGGTIGTNAGGLRVLRFGDTRAQLLGIEAVLGDGSVVSHLGGLARDNTGYSLPALLAGSEGTLGVVTAATLRLHAIARERAVALIGFGSSAEAVVAAGRLRREVPGVEAVELVLAAGVDLVCRVASLRPPLPVPAPACLVVEASGAGALEALADAVAELDGVQDAAAGDDARTRESLWAYRERHTEAINTLGPPVKLDVTLPMGGLADFLDRVPATVRGIADQARVWLFGHAADGNVHVNVTLPDVTSTAGVTLARAVEDAVLRMVAAAGGSISSEHGVGVAKREWLSLTRTTAELAAFAALKRALDPDGVLNPGVLLP